MRKIVYTRPDGGLSVVTPVRNTHPRLEELTDEQVEQRAWAKLPADAINPRFAEESELPKDRTFRNAWKDEGDCVGHDIGKCREITKDRLRRERAPKLADLDVAFQRALEEGKPTAQIVAQKNALRDVTKQVDGARDIDTLRALKCP